MNKLYPAIAAALILAGSSIPVSSADPLWKFDGTQRFVASHDGNCYDKDDIGASAFVWAICWAFGAADKVCHFEHSNNLAGCSDINSSYLAMKASSEEGSTRFGLGAGAGYGQVGIVYSFIADPDACVAHFKTESDKNTATNTIVEICAGPMESTYRNLTATDPAKRRYITMVSHSSWNENFTNINGMFHNWSACKAIPGGAVFVDLRDHSGRLGTSARWDSLKSIGTKNGKTQADWDWLYSRQTMKIGDVSDAEIAFFIFTANDAPSSAQIIAKFNNPGSPVNVIQPSRAPTADLNSANVNLTRTGTNLMVSLTGSPENGTVKVYNMMNRLVCSVPLSMGSAVVPVNSMSRGSYVISIQAGNRKMVKEYINR